MPMLEYHRPKESGESTIILAMMTETSNHATKKRNPAMDSWVLLCWRKE